MVYTFFIVLAGFTGFIAGKGSQSLLLVDALGHIYTSRKKADVFIPD
jgi:hypothetical protein